MCRYLLSLCRQPNGGYDNGRALHEIHSKVVIAIEQQCRLKAAFSGVPSHCPYASVQGKFIRFPNLGNYPHAPHYGNSQIHCVDKIKLWPSLPDFMSNQAHIKAKGGDLYPSNSPQQAIRMLPLLLRSFRKTFLLNGGSMRKCGINSARPRIRGHSSSNSHSIVNASLFVVSKGIAVQGLSTHNGFADL